MNPDTIRSRLKGNIVPVPAQYHEDLSINYSAIQEHVSFLIDKGVKNFYLAMSASEFDYMTGDERVSVTECVANTLRGDCILIAQALGGYWLEEQLTEAKRMVDCGAHAIVIVPRGLKEGGKFFSSHYLRGKYSPERHDDYFVNYIEKIAKETKASIVYHDKPFVSGHGPSLEMLNRIVSIDNVVALKEHVSDLGVLRKVYGEFGERVVCFDGFGKTMQFWSFIWGARARHTCWSWFDPETDNQFMACMQSGDLQGAVQIIKNEGPIAVAISHTGFQGYKYIMKLMGLPTGPVRIPGEEINQKQKEMIKKAVIRMGLIKK
jgi:4-hydroxy-tetrahydrodipicolinate synthase